MVIFDTLPRADRALIRTIANRIAGMKKLHGVICDPLHIQMDLTAVHLNGCPLRLAELAAADNFNFLHDMLGIQKHLDRETGKLDGRFRPRFAAPST